MSVVTNRVSNPSFEAGTTGAAAVAGTSGAAALTFPVVTTPFGTHVLHCQWSTASTAAGGGLYVEVDVAAAGLAVGDVVSAGIFRALASIATRLQFSVEFRTSSATVSTSTGAQQAVGAAGQYGATQVGDDTASWLKLEGLTIPATCTKIRIRLLSVAGTGYANWSIGSYLRVDAFMLAKAATLPPYVDGNLGAGYYWAGTANASLSSLYTPELVVTAYSDMGPSPRATIEVKDPFPDTDHLTVLQLSGDDENEVRSAVDILAIGGTFSTDFEIPLGVDVTYRAHLFTEAGVDQGYTGTSAAVNIAFEPGWVVVQDYLDPSSALLLRAEAAFASSLQKSRASATYRAGTQTIALMGEQGLLEGTSLRVVTESEADTAVMDQILAGGTVLMRTAPNMPVPRLLYVVISTPTKVPHNVRTGGEAYLWDVSGDEVSRNVIDVVVPTVTWQQVIDAYPTWADLIAAHSTWLDLLKNPPPEA